MNNISFKKVKKSYYQDIANLFNYYIVNSTAIAFYNKLSVQEIISYFDIENRYTYSFCIYFNSEFCGFCLIKPYSQKQGYKYTYEITVYLKNEYTHKGIGHEAIQFLEDVARKNGVKTIIAGICSENKASIKLFKMNNYTKCGHFKNMVYKFNKMLDNIYYQKLL